MAERYEPKLHSKPSDCRSGSALKTVKPADFIDAVREMYDEWLEARQDRLPDFERAMDEVEEKGLGKCGKPIEYAIDKTARLKKIGEQVVQAVAEATIEGTLPALDELRQVSLRDMLDSQRARHKECRREGGRLLVTVDDRLVAALYTMIHCESESDTTAGMTSMQPVLEGSVGQHTRILHVIVE